MWPLDLSVLNFNFHTEHHFFPSLPWYRLRAARKLVREALGAEYREAIGIAWNLRNRGSDLQSLLTGGWPGPARKALADGL